jgi:hypothetical protein
VCVCVCGCVCVLGVFNEGSHGETDHCITSPMLATGYRAAPMYTPYILLQHLVGLSLKYFLCSEYTWSVSSEQSCIRGSCDMDNRVVGLSSGKVLQSDVGSLVPEPGTIAFSCLSASDGLFPC